MVPQLNGRSACKVLVLLLMCNRFAAHIRPSPTCFLSVKFVKTKQIDVNVCSKAKTALRSRLKVQCTMKSMLRSDEDAVSPPPRDNRNFLVFLLTYFMVPFLTSGVLNIENDNYQLAKQNFDAAMASFNPQISAPDSAEYIATSNLYNESMQSLFVLLLSKRLALYVLATMATVYAGWRSYESTYEISNGRFSGPGEALDRLNSEILDGEQFDSIRRVNNADDDTNVFATLIDENDQSSNAGTTVAIGLPLVLTASLAASYALIVSDKSKEALPIIPSDDILTEAVPYLASLPGFIVCLLFVCAEFRRVFPSRDSSTNVITPNKEPLLCTGNVMALFYVVGGYIAKTYPSITLNDETIPISFDLWPLQNGINLALATTVARAVGPFLVTSSNKSIRTTALALIGVTLFDGISVFGTVANAAINTDSQISVMEVVAKSKLSFQSSNLVAIPWQPGLLEIIVGHNSNEVTEALGLGDIVFPSILVAWAMNADSTSIDNGDDGMKASFWQYTPAAIFGYVTASLIMEIIGSFSLLGNRGGLPALVFLIPAMLACVTLLAWRRDELQDIWSDD